jgi:biopolymer transport protein ExbD
MNLTSVVQRGLIMQFKSRQRRSKMVEVNLVPMMDVMMTVLTFFIIVAMTLTTQRSFNVRLPSTQAAADSTQQSDPLTVELNLKGQILISNRLQTQSEMLQQMQQYLAKNREGAIVLQADRQLAYQQVIDLLAVMRQVGGERVSLAIEAP